MESNTALCSETAAVIENREPLLPSRLPSLDGWRALSICLVLVEHSLYTFDCPPKTGRFLQAYFDGSLGVRFFFVISGFLITYLLLKEHLETGKISLRNFYARRGPCESCQFISPIWQLFLLCNCSRLIGSLGLPGRPISHLPQTLYRRIGRPGICGHWRSKSSFIYYGRCYSPSRGRKIVGISC